jgi:lipoprotein-anchoring transpeptidase ErfK/SrfK
MKGVWALPFIILIGINLSSCNNADTDKQRAKKKAEKQEYKTEKEVVVVPISYHAVTVSKETIPAIKKDYDSIQMKIILAVNRVDANRWTRLDTLIVPDTFLADFMVYSPFPKNVSTIKDVRKMILYSQSIQAFGAYENGELVRWGPISTGKKTTPTPSKLYHTNWKSKKTVSTVDDEWVMEWYFNMENFEGVSMHQYEMPGYPASHACVRLYKEDAMWFYTWCEPWILEKKQIAAYGTPALVFGEYAFGQRKPWRALPENKDAISLTEKDLNKELEKYMNTIMERQARRDSFDVVKIKT